ncbi:MAG: gliding motility-associated C-terminal domain-containing protein [Bacteroidia bacterium]|jgi:gliding motility-associated-like protein|nr:gliding motility-associated C-terminal domain-containing protein [Bacteroidia bacterium]
MKQIATLFAALMLTVSAFAQDLSVINIISPVSGCALTANENVTIRIFNFGPNLPAGTTFNVSYTINAGAPVTELVTLSSVLLTNSTRNYTFTTQANLTTPGSYIFDATVSIAGDINPTNNAFTGYTVTSTAASVGGTVSGPASVCITGNTGAVTLSGNTGNVIRWEYSTDGGFTWFTLSNTTTSQAFTDLNTQTLYRAVVQNGTCTPATSSIHTINIDNASVGGSISPATSSVCVTANSGTLTLSGRTGNVVRWEFSTDGGVTWNIIANTTATQTFTNIPSTRIYRAFVQNGTCNGAYSANATVTVNPVPVGGTINPAVTTVCAGTNSGTLTLSGHISSVARWEFSIDGGVTWTNISNFTPNQNFSNLTQSRLYRVRVQSGACGVTYSAIAAVNVTTTTVAGTVTPAAISVCTGTNSGVVNLTGSNGSVLFWESSTDGGITWTNIANTTTVQAYNNLTTTTMYRAFSQSGGCTGAYSPPTTITVNGLSLGGSVSGGMVVCSGTNSGTLNLSGQNGSVVTWQSSNDGIIWNNIANTTASQSFLNITDTTFYRAIVANGVCPSDTSAVDTLFVDSVTVGGTLSPAAAVVCSGQNNGTIVLSGHVGNVLRWEYSTDNGLTWITISNTSSSQAYTNVSVPTLYRAVVQSGVCALAYSSTTLLTLNAPSAAGTLYGSNTVCSGSNSGLLTLVGAQGNILNWEASMDGGITWMTIANTTANYNFLNLTDTTIYRAVVANGICPADTSTLVTIFVDSPSVGGVVSVSDTVCSGANSGTVTLSGQVGIVDGWEYSIDGGVTWIYISNSTTTQGYSNLTQTTSYRARVKNGVCPPITSIEATITVDVPSIGGTVSGSTAVCISGNSGTLTLTGSSGNITTWESSTDGGLTWVPNGNTTTSQPYTNLTDTTWYRAIVQSGVCGGDTSTVGVITVDPATVGGVATPSDTVCAGANGGVIRVVGFVGNIIRWETSVDGNNWIAFANTSDSLIYSNLNQTTYYRALVQSGVCAPALYSAIDTIVVTTPASAGSIIGAASVCVGTGSGTLTLQNFVGNVTSWQSSTDGGATWTNIANTSATQNWSAPADTIWYRAIVANGACAPDTSAPAMIAVLPQPVAAFTAAPVCLGNMTNFVNTTTVSQGFIIFQSWDFGDNDASIAANPTHPYSSGGNYNVTLITISNSGCSDTATGVVTVNALPVASITASGNTTLCAGDSITLSVPLTATNTYSWSTSAITNSIVVNTAATYSVTVTDTNTGCQNSDSVEVNVIPSPVAYAGLDQSVSSGETIQLLGSGGSLYNWSPSNGLSNINIASPLATVPFTITYTLTVTDLNGCSDTDAVTITLLSDFNLVVANLMTPNGDGFNDVWNVIGIDQYPGNRVTIYNRNGMLVYETENYNNTWGGTFNGAELPDGTYYYVITFPDSDREVKGAITILHEGK